MSPAFRRPVVAWLAGVSGCSLALALAFVIAQPDDEVVSADADAFSRSALGHRAFVDLLRAEGVPVIVSRYASAERAGHGLLLLAEPRTSVDDPGRGRSMGSMIGRARSVLLVLPKWKGEIDSERPQWIASVKLVAMDLVAAQLAIAGVAASVSREAEPLGRCAGTEAAMTWRQPQLLKAQAPGVRPLIECASGILLAEVRRADGGRIIVLSDPDVIANHALGDGDHARLALEVVARARAEGQPVIIDETLHGHERPPVLWRELFAFPLLPAVAQGMLALLAFVASGLARFGAPVPALAALGSGKSLLIQNTASLLRKAGHSAHTLGRYLDAAMADVARALHAPATRDSDGVPAWLQRAGRRRGVRIDVERLRAQVEELRRRQPVPQSAVVAAAQRIHRWKQEMLSGPTDDPVR